MKKFVNSGILTLSTDSFVEKPVITLIDTNADTHSNYKYTWVIDRTNYNNKYLYLSLDTSNRKKTVKEEVNDTGIFAYLPLILIIVGAIVVGWLVVKKGDKRNQV